MKMTKEYCFSFSLTSILIVTLYLCQHADCMNATHKNNLREKTLHMFRHAYSSYMTYAYPADELMPLSCSGRYRGSHKSRGDVDDSLGNFSLTLVDTLDTLAVLGEVELFEDAVRLVLKDVTFDTDVVVSVFETNIRMLGGLLGGHVMATYYQEKGLALSWYANQLLDKAVDLAQRLLQAFNTSSGLPYPRVNLRHGVKRQKSRTGHEKDTCTSCAGTIILEFAALSRLTGDPIYEEKAHQAMDFLWGQRHRVTDLVGTVINIHNGDWVRRESGIGAGIDSYYEYLLKGYVLLGEEKYLTRFNKHYEAIMRYINQGPLMINVHMHKPQSTARNYMDSLLAFWPGLQVLKGDIRPAIEIHEMLYQVIQKHKFLPEAFTTDFRVHWGQHPLRPEFIESTYFLYKATGDPHYLEVGELVLENLEKHGRVKCGYAALKDVTTGKHEDQMDSYVLAETFKYLYLLFSDKDQLILDVDDYVFTTEAHLLPLSLGTNSARKGQDVVVQVSPSNQSESSTDERTCPNANFLFPGDSNYAHSLRNPLKDYVENSCPKSKRTTRITSVKPSPSKSTNKSKPRLRASNFIAGDRNQVATLGRMGIKIMTMSDGRVQLLHTSAEATSQEEADDGLLFMEEMIELSRQQQQQEVQHEPRLVQVTSAPYFGQVVFTAGPAQFGTELSADSGVSGYLAIAQPLQGCTSMKHPSNIKDKIVIVERGQCMFVDKARQIQAAGAIGGIVFDNTPGLSSSTAPLFAMSGDGRDDVHIPMVFLFKQEAEQLMDYIEKHADLKVYLGHTARKSEDIMREMLIERNFIGKNRNTEPPNEQHQIEPQPPKSKTTPTYEPLDDVKLFNVDDMIDIRKEFSDMIKHLTLMMGKPESSMDLLDVTATYLKEHTNFDELDETDAYLDAVLQFINNEKTEETTRTINKLLEVLEFEDDDVELGGQDDFDMPEGDAPEKCFEAPAVIDPVDGGADGIYEGLESSHAAVLLELAGQLQEAPDWLDMEDMNLFMDKNGNMYVKDLKEKILKWKKELEDGKIRDATEDEGYVSDDENDQNFPIDEGTLVYDPQTYRERHNRNNVLESEDTVGTMDKHQDKDEL